MFGAKPLTVFCETSKRCVNAQTLPAEKSTGTWPVGGVCAQQPWSGTPMPLAYTQLQRQRSISTADFFTWTHLLGLSHEGTFEFPCSCASLI